MLLQAIKMNWWMNWWNVLRIVCVCERMGGEIQYNQRRRMVMMIDSFFFFFQETTLNTDMLSWSHHHHHNLHDIHDQHDAHNELKKKNSKAVVVVMRYHNSFRISSKSRIIAWRWAKPNIRIIFICVMMKIAGAAIKVRIKQINYY